jgi:hypothetical protein
MRVKEGSYNPKRPSKSIYFTMECKINEITCYKHTLELITTYIKYNWRRVSVLLDKDLLLINKKCNHIMLKERPSHHVRGSRRTDL